MNVMGTVNVLEAVRADDGVERRQRHHRQVLREPGVGVGLRENELNGRPRSLLEHQGLRRAGRRRLPPLVLRAGDGGPRLGTARAGNVIGGGDWGEDRLVPDIVRARARGRADPDPQSRRVRPWQHVLDPLSGYLVLAEALCGRARAPRRWNFGPAPARTSSRSAGSSSGSTSCWDGEIAGRSTPASTRTRRSDLEIRLDDARAPSLAGALPGTSARALDASSTWYAALDDRTKTCAT